MYYIPSRDTSVEQVIEKSRFIACIHKCSDPAEAKDHVARLKKENPKARHVAYAWYFGDATAPRCGSSDDGEPKGTAGRPVLEAILEKKARNLVLAVVRYFGGKKLGAAGLTRAYHATAVAGLNACCLKEDIRYNDLDFIVEYDKYEAVKKVCEENGWAIKDEQFAEKVTITLSVRDGVIPEFPWGLISKKEK